jgi:hypothetical protein
MTEQSVRDSNEGPGEALKSSVPASHSSERLETSVSRRLIRPTGRVPASMLLALRYQEALMFPRYRHTPVLDPKQKRCAVCHEAVYSLAGIHPQCAIKRAVALESRRGMQAASKADARVAAVGSHIS